MRIYSKASTTKANYSINNENQVEALRVANLFFPERDIFMILCDTVGSVIFMQKNLNWMWIMLAAPLYIGNSEPFERRSTLSLFSQPTRRRFGFQRPPVAFNNMPLPRRMKIKKPPHRYLAEVSGFTAIMIAAFSAFAIPPMNIR